MRDWKDYFNHTIFNLAKRKRIAAFSFFLLFYFPLLHTSFQKRKPFVFLQNRIPFVIIFLSRSKSAAFAMRYHWHYDAISMDSLCKRSPFERQKRCFCALIFLLKKSNLWLSATYKNCVFRIFKSSFPLPDFFFTLARQRFSKV